MNFNSIVRATVFIGVLLGNSMLGASVLLKTNHTVQCSDGVVRQIPSTLYDLVWLAESKVSINNNNFLLVTPDHLDAKEVVESIAQKNDLEFMYHSSEFSWDADSNEFQMIFDAAQACAEGRKRVLLFIDNADNLLYESGIDGKYLHYGTYLFAQNLKKCREHRSLTVVIQVKQQKKLASCFYECFDNVSVLPPLDYSARKAIFAYRLNLYGISISEVLLKNLIYNTDGWTRNKIYVFCTALSWEARQHNNIAVQETIDLLLPLYGVSAFSYGALLRKISLIALVGIIGVAITKAIKSKQHNNKHNVKTC